MKTQNTRIYTILFLLLVLCPIIEASAQKNGHILERDSLLAITNSPNDSLKMEAFFKLGNLYRAFNFDSARTFFHKSISLAKNLKIEEKLPRAINGIAITYGMESDYSSALEYFLRSKNQYELLDDTIGIIRSFNNIGLVYKRIGDYSQAFKEYNKAMGYSVALGDSLQIAQRYRDIGVLHDLMGNDSLAFQYFHRSKNINKQLGEEKSLAAAYNSLGVMHHQQKNYDSAEYYYKLYIDYYKDGADLIPKAQGLSNLGNLYIKMDLPEFGLLTLKEAEKTIEHLNVPHEKSNIMYNQALGFLQLENYEESLKYLNRANEDFKEYQDIQDRMELQNLMSRVYDSLGDYQKALQHKRLAAVYKDSLINVERLKEFRNSQFQQDIYQKELEIMAQESQVEILEARLEYDRKAKVFWGIGTALLASMVFLLIVANRSRNRHNRILKEKNKLIISQKGKIEEMNMELESRMLRAQMDPHFIFNSLSSIQHFVIKNDQKAAVNYLTKFSKLLRGLLESSINYMISLEEEISLLENYLLLESLRFGDKFSYKFTVSDNTNPSLIEIPILLFQPFVENSIIHGLMPKGDVEKTVEIFFERKEDILFCIIRDNGIGLKKAKENKTDRKHRSRGMDVTLRRLEKHNLKTAKPIEYKELYDSQGSVIGTEVIIQVELSY